MEVTDNGDQEITTDKSEQLDGFQSSTESERQQTFEKQWQHMSKQVVIMNKRYPGSHQLIGKQFEKRQQHMREQVVNTQQEIPGVTSFGKRFIHII